MDLPGADALNALSPSAFAEALAPLFEGAPQFLQRLAGTRPFDSDAALMAAARRVAVAAPNDELIELLDAHPRIGADPVDMSALSRGEQNDGSAANAVVARDLADLNATYEARFGFRYVIFVAGRSRSAIVPLLQAALRSNRQAELRRGVEDAISIATDRLHTQRAAVLQPEEIAR